MSRPAPPVRPARTAIIDIGSNTTTLAVYDVAASGAVDRVLQRGDALRLLRAIGPDRALSTTAIERTLAVLRGFGRVAREAGAPQVHCIATSAVRDARNGSDLLARIRAEPGLSAELLSEEEEGLAAATSAVNQLPLVDGCMIDLGGGSLQIVSLAGRRATHAASLPLGALRSADAFFKGDPPTGAEVTALRRHVAEQVRRACPWLGPQGTLVVVGGTPRAFAKIDRRQTGSRINHSHGYRIELDTLEAIFETTSRLPVDRRREISGLSPHRVDVVPAGALTVLTFMRVFGFTEFVVSHYGVREGVALRRALGQAEPLLPDVRDAGLTLRFPALARPPLPRGVNVVGAPPRADDGRVAELARRAVVELGVAAPMGLAPIVARLLALGEPEPIVAHLLEEPTAGFLQSEVLRLVQALGPGGDRDPLRVVGEVAVQLAAAGFEGPLVREAPALSPALRVRIAALRAR